MSTGPVTTRLTLPAYVLGLVDNAAIFPPGNSPLDTAVRAHREHRVASYAGLVGPFVVSDVKLPDLREVISREPVETPLRVAVVVTGGAGSLEPAVRWTTGTDGLELAALEIAIRDSDTGDLAHNAARIVTAVDMLRAEEQLSDDVEVYVEPPPLHGDSATHGWLGALDAVAEAGFRLKFRTGGVTADTFPTAHDLGAGIGHALDRETAFKCTAGLHRALRHHDDETGFEHHGFLNVLLATRSALDGNPEAAWTNLDEHDPGIVLATLNAFTAEELLTARRWFTSFGSCSILEPLEDLIELGMIEARDHS